MTKTMKELRFVVMHNRIADLAKLAVDRGQITSCSRIIGTDNYLMVLAGEPELFPKTYTGVQTGTLLYLLNSQYIGKQNNLNPATHNEES